MRGIVLAGGTGSRLGLLTQAVNKHLLPVRGVPMVFHPLRVLRENGIDDITIVSSPEGVGQLARLLGGGYTYRVQEKPGGIAQALLCAESKSRELVAVILGDNVFLPSPVLELTGLASVFLVEVDDPRQSGVAVLDWQTVVGIVEKPEQPPSNYAVAGLYLFDASIFQRLRDSQPLREYALTEQLDAFAKQGQLSSSILHGFWGDAGTIEGIKRCEF